MSKLFYCYGQRGEIVNEFVIIYCVGEQQFWVVLVFTEVLGRNMTKINCYCCENMK